MGFRGPTVSNYFSEAVREIPCDFVLLSDCFSRYPFYFAILEYLFVCVFLSFSLRAFLSVCLSFYLYQSVCLSISFSLSVFLSLSVCLPVSVCLSVCLSLSVCVSLSLALALSLS